MLKKLFSYGIAVALILTIIGPAYAAGTDKPSAAFFDKSWLTMDNLKTWSDTCTIKISPITIVGETTAEQKAVLDIFSKAFKLFSKQYTDIYRLDDKLLSSFGKKTDTLTPIGEVGKIANNKLLDNVNSASKVRNQGYLILYANDIYFHEGQMPAWKMFAEPNLAETMWAGADESMSQRYEKTSFVFSKWGANKKTAIYTGKATAEKTKTSIKNLFGPGLEEGQKQAKIVGTVNVQTGLWEKTVATSEILSGVMKFTITQSCTTTTKAAKTKITVPTEFETLDKETGTAQLMDLVLKIM